MTMSYVRRQQLRRLKRAAWHGMGAAVALGAAVLAADAGELAAASALALAAGSCALTSRRALRLAGRSRIGAESEARVRRELEALARAGWRVRHAVDWPRRGDLDHVVHAPSGVGFVVETKTLRYTRAHRARTADAARWLTRRRRQQARGVRAVICITRARSVERVEDDVLIVSLDRLAGERRAAERQRSSRGRRAMPSRRMSPITVISATPSSAAISATPC